MILKYNFKACCKWSKEPSNSITLNLCRRLTYVTKLCKIVLKYILFSEYIEHRLEHFRQRYNWDCGVSCVLMLLPVPQREEMLDKFEMICQDEGFNQSTWTIDLCYLLKRLA